MTLKRMVMWNTSTKRLVSWFQRVGNGIHKVAFTDWTPISKSMPLSLYVYTPFAYNSAVLYM